MSAPAALHVHGATPVLAAVDETLSSTVTLAVDELSFEDGRSVEKVKDVDQKTFRTKALDPHLKISLKGQAQTLTGVIANKVGYEATATLTNFGATIFDYDPTVGTILCTSNKRTVSHIQDQLKVDQAYEHLPFVVDA
jgi:hypothetical protein